MVRKSFEEWDIKLSHAEFFYNESPSYTTSHSLFKVYYGLNPLTPLDLIPILEESKVSIEA